MVTDPSKERIAAALALAEAVDTWDDFCGYYQSPGISGTRAHKCRDALAAYRATLPKLRTRAEVDAEIATIVRIAFGAGSVQVRSGAVNMTARIEALCDEPTTDYGPSGVEVGISPRPESVTGATSTEPCSCDEALELRRIIKHVHELALEIARVTETTPG